MSCSRLCASLVFVAAMFAWTSIRGAASAQSVRQEVWFPDAAVRAVVASGNTLYIGGEFTTVGPPTGSGVLFDKATGNPIGGVPRVVGEVRVAVPDGSGGWYIGGRFTAVGGLPRSNIAHIAPDQTVSAWNPNSDAPVEAIAIAGTTVYVGGFFSNIGGHNRANIAALSATTGQATSWNPFANVAVHCLAVDSANVYAGGQFTTIGGQPRSRIAALSRINGTATSWNPNADSAVLTLVLDGTTIYAGGYFTTIGGQVRNRIAALDVTGSAALAWDPNADELVSAVRSDGSTVYACGAFTNIGGQARGRIAALDKTSGLASAWNPDANGPVNSIAVDGAHVYAGGDYSQIGGANRRHFAALGKVTGVATPWDTRAHDEVLAVADDGADVYVGGSFTSIGGVLRNGLAALDLSTGLPTPWDPNVMDGALPGTVQAMAISGNTVYAAGTYTSVGGQSRSRLAALNATTGAVTPWDPSPDGSVRVITPNGSTIYVGGAFLNVGGAARNRIAALDATSGLATSWDPNATSGAVRAILVAGGTVYVAGSFSQIGGQTRHRLAALDGAGLATAWNPNIGAGTLETLQLDGDTLYLGGDLSTIGGQSRSGAGAVSVTTGLPTAFNPNASSGVHALALQGSTVYAAGDFSVIGGQPREGIAALDATTSLATPWNVGGADPFEAFAISLVAEHLYIGGRTFELHDLPNRNLVAVQKDTSPWNSLWHVDTETYPDQLCSWDLFDTAAPESPALSGSSLLLSTSDASENMYYEQTNDLAIPNDLQISARFRVLSETHLAGNPRRGVAVEFAVAPDSANFLFVGRDTVFLWSAFATQGATALVDTDDAFHTYDIRVTNRSAVTVYQDDAQILTGSIVFVGPGNIPEPTIAWGDITLSSFAVSEWIYFRHNASTIQCGTSAVGVALDGVPGPAAPLTLRTYPNPTTGALTLAIDASATLRGPARAGVYDVTGRLVRRFDLGIVPQGTTRVRWDGRDESGHALSSGVYFVRFESEGRSFGEPRKITLLR